MVKVSVYSSLLEPVFLLNLSSCLSSLCHNLFQPPIQIFGLEGRYATALFSGASKMKALDAAEKDLINIQVT